MDDHDATLSPDNNWLAYSSITPYVHLVKTRGEDAVLGLGRIVAYDVETRTIMSNIKGHSNDTNAVEYILSSDDSYIKVWDRRCLEDARPAGALLGHTEGITYVSSKGDGRFIVSNGKDQAAKLWDLRKMISGADFESMKKPKTSINAWDYRHGTYARPKYLKHLKILP
ncbi:hypothetical protein H4Q26_008873 [Puccinia striiformis f. sp. tritici PST-130]|nr:hypothetical protein H4Q26_008873 [Puccinia striiformis f. sp. tritici PST-130]